jgi:nucleoid DNA-binding protein
LKVEHFIIQTLKNSNRIVVPGLGTFFGKPQGALLNKADSSITPPSKEIKYISLESGDKTELSKIIQKENSITEIAANSLIDSFVKKIKNDLNTKGTSVIEGLGTLQYSKGKILALAQDSKESLLKDSFGLREVSLPGSDKSVVNKTQSVPTYKTTPPKSTTSKRPEAKRPEVKRPAGKKPVPQKSVKKARPVKAQKEKAKSSGSKAGIIAAWIAMIVVVLGLLWYILFVHLGLSTADFGTDFLSSKTAIDSIEMVITNEPVNDSISGIPEESYTYYIITGSFTKYSNAEKFIKGLSDQGYEPEIIENEDGKYKVSIASYPLKNEALDAVEFYRQQKDKRNCWILKRRN